MKAGYRESRHFNSLCSCGFNNWGGSHDILPIKIVVMGMSRMATDGRKKETDRKEYPQE